MFPFIKKYRQPSNPGSLRAPTLPLGLRGDFWHLFYKFWLNNRGDSLKKLFGGRDNDLSEVGIIEKEKINLFLIPTAVNSAGVIPVAVD